MLPLRLKRYTAASIQEALERVRAEMGDGALIVETRRIRPWWRLWGRPSVEVVAALDLGASDGAASGAAGRRAPAPAAEPRPHPPRPRAQPPDSERPPAAPQASGGAGVRERTLWFERLVERDVEASLAWEIVQRAERLARATGRPMAEAVADQVGAFVPTMPVWERQERPRFVMLVGPTGTGKTTTLAKLAANFALIAGWRVGLVTTDTFRIGAVHQLRTYAELVGLPLWVVRDGQELQGIADVARQDLVLIDTTGHNPGDGAKLAATLALVRSMPPETLVLLVVPAGVRQSDLAELLAAYRPVPVHGVVVTKVDETRRRGTLLNAPRWAGCPLAYITTGQIVPDDIEVADAETVARWLLADGPASGPGPERGRQT